jgi:hypothetical protein
MSILPRFAREKKLAPVDLPPECGHWELAPRWDNCDDIGKKEKITFYTCSSCKENFSPPEADRLKAA